LDLGCGTGRHTFFFAERGFDVYGFDFSSYAVQCSIEKLRARNLSAHLVVWDMTKKFHYESEFFDAVIAVRVIHHARMNDIKHVFSETSRILGHSRYFYFQVPTLGR
jgi:SAM-dependent methyltransferase